MSRALRALKDLGILMWVQGGGGEVSDTNTYTLSLAAMRRVVKEQGVFDMETGKLIRQSRPSPVTVPASIPLTESCSDGLGGVASTDKTDTTVRSGWKDVKVDGVVVGRMARVSDLVKQMTAIKPSPIGNDEVSAVK